MIEGIFELLFELLFNLFGELITQLFAEIFSQTGQHFTRNSEKHRFNPIVLAVGYTITGAAAGGISLIFLPHYLIEDESIRVLFLCSVPLLVSGSITGLNEYRLRKASRARRVKSISDTFDTGRFFYGFAFAFTFAVIRFLFTTQGNA